MRKIRVVHYCNQLSIGGTERTIEIFCKHLDRERFDVFVVSRRHHVPFPLRMKVELGSLLGVASARGKKKLWASMDARLPNFERILGADHVFLARDDDHLRETILELKPDVLHVYYSGAPEPPTSDEQTMTRVPVTLTTNPFERENTAPAHRYVKRMLFMSRWLLKERSQWAATDPRADVLYNPIELPCSNENLRARLGIPADAFVLGRVGRADPGIHDPISLKAFATIANGRSWFLALAAPENMIRQAREMGLKNFMALPATADDSELSRFYNTLDVLAHARRDGETFGCNIAEAMMHGVPVVSHLTPFMNAQIEVIGDAGFVCAQDDWQTYAHHLARLRDDAPFRAELSRKAKTRALELFEAKRVTRQLEKIYGELLYNYAACDSSDSCPPWPAPRG